MKNKIDEIELNAEMRNKIQAPLLVLNNLHKGKGVPKKLVAAALKDIEELKGLVEDL